VAICWKTTQNHHLPKVLPPLLHPGSLILMLQNGLGVEADVALQFPMQAVAGGIAYLCSNKIAPGHIDHLDYGKLVLGSLDETVDLKGVIADFQQSRVPCEWTPNLEQARWQKLIWNIPFNGLCALHDRDTRQNMQDPETHERVAKLMQEVWAASAACGAPQPIDCVEKMLAFTAKMVPYMPSMQLDFRKGTPSELEFIFRRPLAAAEATGVAMEETTRLLQQLEEAKAVHQS